MSTKNLISRTFPFGSVIRSMTYNNNTMRLVIEFKKKVGIQYRSYENVSSTDAYKLYYTNQPKDIMSYYSTYIKGHHNVSEVTNKI